MNGLLHHMSLSLRLNFRSIQALVYGYIFPILFLLGFGSIYSKENPPLQNELGQLLTVTILSGACFGMPTSMVSERERGVWRRYRLLPSATGGIVLSAMVVRCLIVFIAFVMQIVLAHFIYKTHWPAHPWMLVGIFFFVTFAFLGLGLVIAMLADNVPAVQALGQAIFLPMIMIGGVGIKLDQLPEWARHVAAFLPGLYSVDAIDAALHDKAASFAVPLHFCLIALTVIGLAGLLAGRQMFRWDAAQKMRGSARGWVLVALGAWVGIGLVAESNGSIRPRRYQQIASNPPATLPSPSPTTAATEPATQPVATTAPTTSPLMAKLAPWLAITDADIDKITYDDLPPDAGTVVPVATSLDNLDDEGKKLIDEFTSRLDNWEPGRAANLEQRVRNLLGVIAIADVLQDAHEGDFPVVVFEHLRFDIPEDNLKKILAYIIQHPEGGKVPEEVPELGVEGKVFEEGVRERSQAYAVKLLGRIVGKIK
jgi:ABC-type multidrug transport system permease subunit